MSDVPKEPEYGESESDSDSQAADPDLSGAAYSTLLPAPDPDLLKQTPVPAAGPDQLDAFLERPYKRTAARRQSTSNDDISLEVFIS